MSDHIATLIAAASNATERATKSIYLAHARVELAREAAKHREQAILLEALESELARLDGLPPSRPQSELFDEPRDADGGRR